MLSATNYIWFRRLVLAGFVILVILFYFLNDPADETFGVPCMLHATTGWLCWGCGGQRAFHQLLHGNLANAFHLNALVFPVLTLLSFVLFEELFQQKPNYSWLRKRNIKLSALVLFLGFTVLRNIL